MPQRPGVPSVSKRPGVYERNPGLPPRVTCERVELDDDPDGEVWFWDKRGNLYADRELQQPLGLTIVRLR